MVYIIASAVLLINVPFGYWRKSVRKFSFSWFASIHIPVIISIFLRYIVNIETRFTVVLLFVSAFFVGQLLGKYVYGFYPLKKDMNLQ